MCPRCQSPDSRVLDSRPQPETQSVRRRRLCEACGHRYTTWETTRRPGEADAVFKTDVEALRALLARALKRAEGMGV